MRIEPFRSLRPAPGFAAQVASPPYDVVSREQAARLAAGNPRSFLHVSRAEIDLPALIDPHDERVHALARGNLHRLIAEGTLVRDRDPALYIYREAVAGHAQLGVVGCVGVGDLRRGVIKAHETTRPDKEDDRLRHMLALGAHAEAVLLAYRNSPEIDGLVAAELDGPPLFDFTAADSVRHSVWRVGESAPYAKAFEAVRCAYIADGHHRSASASRAAEVVRAEGRKENGCEWFPAVLVPATALRILAYNRLITDLGGLTPGDVLAQLGAIGALSPTESWIPPRPASFCIYVGRRWHRLELDIKPGERADPLRRLDVCLLQERVLGPVFGIEDQRSDNRVDFVAAVGGAAELEARVDSGEAAAAISMVPTAIRDVMAVSDAGLLMPPKSTWFDPKIASGLFVHPFD